MVADFGGKTSCIRLLYFVRTKTVQQSQGKNHGSKITFMHGKKLKALGLKKIYIYNEEIVTISQSLIKSDYVNFFVQMVRSSGFKILFGSLTNLANVNQQFQCCNHKRKSGTNQIPRHEIHVSDTNHIISNEKNCIKL